MGLLKNKICPKCGEEFSFLKASCPACGTKKQNLSSRTPANSDTVRQGTAANKRAEENAKWQFIFGLCLVAAVIIAVIVLITTTLKGGYDSPALETPPPSQLIETTPSPAPSPTPTPTPNVEWLKITYYNDERTEFGTTVGGQTSLGTNHFPIEIEGTVEWSSTDETICTVNSDGVVTGVGRGTATIIARLYNAAVECIVYVS